MQDALKPQHLCNHRTEMIACRHLVEHHAPVEVLLVRDDGHVDFALCLNCGELEQPDEKLLISTCIDCAGQVGIPARMPTPGRWQVGELQEPVH